MSCDDVASTSLGGSLTRRRLHAENAVDEGTSESDDDDEDGGREWQLGMEDLDEDDDVEEDGEEDDEDEDDDLDEDNPLSEADQEV